MSTTLQIIPVILLSLITLDAAWEEEQMLRTFQLLCRLKGQ
jgi:hypothetical protein